MKLPSYLKKYFWEADVRELNIAEHRIYILKRLLEYGDPKAISWAWRIFSKKDWLEALKSRGVSSRTRDFWPSILSYKK